MVIVLPIQLLMPAGAILGFAEALALAEALVVVGAEAAADSDFGGKFKLASSCRKDEYYAKR
jgi:hypothetical protein